MDVVRMRTSRGCDYKDKEDGRVTDMLWQSLTGMVERFNIMNRHEEKRHVYFNDYLILNRRT